MRKACGLLATTFVAGTFAVVSLLAARTRGADPVDDFLASPHVVIVSDEAGPWQEARYASQPAAADPYSTEFQLPSTAPSVAPSNVAPVAPPAIPAPSGAGHAVQPSLEASSAWDEGSYEDGCDDGCGCGRRVGLLDMWSGRRGCRGQQAFSACGCNGSYKFPVPPLFTYHWPGMYSHELMTNYHSPWRFPPLKPYVDERPLPKTGRLEGPAITPPIVPTSATLGRAEGIQPRRIPSQIEPVSAKMRRLYGLD